MYITQQKLQKNKKMILCNTSQLCQCSAE